MAKTHFTNFGPQYAPPVADRDGYITYNAKHVKQITRQLRRGFDLEEIAVDATPGTWYVATASWNCENNRINYT